MVDETKTPQSSRSECGIEQLEEEVFEVDRKISTRTIAANKAIVIQTIALIITLIGLAIAAERRITTVEIKTENEIQIRAQADASLLDAIQKLQTETKELSQSQVRIVTILDVIDRRNPQPKQSGASDR